VLHNIIIMTVKHTHIRLQNRLSMCLILMILSASVVLINSLSIFKTVIEHLEVHKLTFHLFVKSYSEYIPIQQL